jgi:hypothetical protein
MYILAYNICMMDSEWYLQQQIPDPMIHNGIVLFLRVQVGLVVLVMTDLLFQKTLVEPSSRKPNIHSL